MLKADHPSNRQSDLQVRARIAYNTPSQPVKCKLCGWPGTFNGVCYVCQELVASIQRMWAKPYWLEIEAEERQRHLRGQSSSDY